MAGTLSRTWREFKRRPAGKRFQERYEKHQHSRLGSTWWGKLLFAAAGVVFIAIGIVLVFIPGPAVVFFALAGGVFASQSRRVARWMDEAEVKIRELIKRLQRWRHQRSHS